MTTTVEYIIEVEAGKAQEGLKKTGNEAKKTSGKLKKARASARGLSGSFQAVGEVAGFLSPELAALGAVAMGGARSFRAFGRSLASGNPIIIGVTVAITAAIAAYALFTKSAKDERIALDKLNKVLEENTKKIRENQKAYDDAEASLLRGGGAVNDLRNKYALLSGSISEADFAEAQRAQKAAQFASDQQDQLTAQIAARKEALIAARAGVDALKDELDRLKTKGSISRKNTTDIIKANAKVKKGMAGLASIQGEINRLQISGARRVEEQSGEYEVLLGVIARAEAAEKKKDDAIARAKTRRLALERQLASIQKTAEGLASKLLNAQIARMSPIKKINAEYDREVASLNRIEADINAQFAATEKIARSKKDGVKLAEIQAAKVEALAQVEALRGDAEIARRKKVGDATVKAEKRAADATKKAQKDQDARQRKLDQNRETALKEVSNILKKAGSDQLTQLDIINKLEQDRLDKLILIGKQEGINTTEAQKAVKGRAKRDRSTVKQGGIEKVGGIAETAITAVGDPSSMISAVGSAFGPTGTVVAGIASALSSLGEKDPEEIKKEFEATFQGIAQGIKILIPLLLEALPPILFEAAGMIIDAVIQLPFLIVAGFIKGIAGIWDRVVLFFKEGFWKSLGNVFSTIFENLVKLITEPFNNLFGDSKMGGGRMLSAQGGLRFTGANQGIAMLHQGEMVVPRSGQMSSTVKRDVDAQVGGGGVTININSAITERSAVDALVRKIEQRFGGFGQSTSPLFGGL